MALMVALATCALAVTVRPAQASFVSKVTVTSNELHNRECLDWNPFCVKPDLFARAWLVNADGTQIRYPDGAAGPITTGCPVRLTCRRPGRSDGLTARLVAGLDDQQLGIVVSTRHPGADRVSS
jgi:hypothetical protein